MATVLITGGTGLIGKALTKELLSKGYQVIILTRNKSRQQSLKNLQYAEWDIDKGFIEPAAIAKADCLIHLAGANVAGGRWTEKRKNQIRDSRTQSAALLVKKMQEVPNNIKAVISASAIGWYGPDPMLPNPTPFKETAKADKTFLGEICRLWEESLEPVTALGKRLIKLRTGIVLSKEGGAYKEFKKPMQFGVAAIMGTGKQVVSWIHIKDVVGIYLYALENENLYGVYNAVAPQQVTNQQLISAMAKERGSTAFTVKVPEFALKLALGEMSIEVLKSATVSSSKIEAAGYVFQFPSIEAAVKNLEKD